MLQCIIWQFSMQFSVRGGLETTRLKMSLMVLLVLDVSITRSSASYHIKTLVCSWIVGPKRGRSNEVVEVMSRRKVDIWGLQEVRWNGTTARLVKGKDSRFKLFWVGNDEDIDGVEFYWQKSGWRHFLMLSVFQIKSC